MDGMDDDIFSQRQLTQSQSQQRGLAQSSSKLSSLFAMDNEWQNAGNTSLAYSAKKQSTVIQAQQQQQQAAATSSSSSSSSSSTATPENKNLVHFAMVNLIK